MKSDFLSELYLFLNSNLKFHSIFRTRVISKYTIWIEERIGMVK